MTLLDLLAVSAGVCWKLSGLGDTETKQPKTPRLPSPLVPCWGCLVELTT